MKELKIAIEKFLKKVATAPGVSHIVGSSWYGAMGKLARFFFWYSVVSFVLGMLVGLASFNSIVQIGLVVGYGYYKLNASKKKAAEAEESKKDSKEESEEVVETTSEDK